MEDVSNPNIWNAAQPLNCLADLNDYEKILVPFIFKFEKVLSSFECDKLPKNTVRDLTMTD